MLGVRDDLLKLRQELPERQSKSDLVLPNATSGIAPLENACVRDSRERIARDVDEAAALEREVVRHGPFCIPPSRDDHDTRMRQRGDFQASLKGLDARQDPVAVIAVLSVCSLVMILLIH
jgi:hypothetical protein